MRKKKKRTMMEMTMGGHPTASVKKTKMMTENPPGLSK
jgi:hypothetical protein